MLDMHPHWEHLAEQSFGTIEEVTVIASTHIPARVDEDGRRYAATADDAAYGILRLTEGTVVQIDSSSATRVRRDDLPSIDVDGTDAATHDHALAVELLGRHDGHQLLTSNHVVGETWTMLRRRAGFTLAVQFLDRLDRSRRLTVEHVSKELEAKAWSWLRSHDERGYSFVDATSFAAMTSRRVREALAFDGDFSAAGFVELR